MKGAFHETRYHRHGLRWIGDRRLWRERVQDRKARFSDLSGTVSAGQCVDFVVSPGASDSFDSFSLSGQISMKVQAGGIIDGDTKRDFFGVLDDTPHQPLGRLAQLAQTLMLANEFIFVD